MVPYPDQIINFFCVETQHEHLEHSMIRIPETGHCINATLYHLQTAVEQTKKILIKKGEDVDILIKDIGFVIASAEIKKGQEVTATTGGKAAVAAAGDYVIGVALNNVSAGGYSRLQLSKYQKAKA